MTLITKAFNCLELFLHNNIEMDLDDIAKLSGMHRATTYRILSEMVTFGYLKKEKRGKYSLGTKFLDFCGYIKSNMKIKEICTPYLVQLTKKSGEASLAAIWDGEKAIITEYISTNQLLRVVPNEGVNIPLHSTAHGKIFLANMSESLKKEYFSNLHLEKRTHNTITDIKELRKHLDIIKKDGVASDYEEEYIGVNGVSIAVRDFSREVIGAIGIIGPSSRFTRTKIKKSTPLLLEYANKISTQLGYTTS